MKTSIVNKLLHVILFLLAIIFFTNCSTLKHNKSYKNSTIVLHGSFTYNSEKDYFSQKCILFISDENINIKVLNDFGIVISSIKFFNDSIFISGLLSQKYIITDTSAILKNRDIKIKLDIIKGLILNNVDSSFISKCFVNNINCYISDNDNISEFDRKVDLYDLKNNNLVTVIYKDNLKKKGIKIPKEIAIKLLNINLKIIVESVDVRSN